MTDFLDLPDAGAEADVVLLPLPFDGTACYGKGTARGPAAVIEASTHVELWDEELNCDLDRVRFHTAAAVEPAEGESPENYLARVRTAARALHGRPARPLVLGVGGEHSLTPPLVRAACDSDDLTGLTVVQFDAHSDLRDEYLGGKCSHACAMRRVVERGANVIAIGIRSADGDEFAYGRDSGRVETFFAQQLDADAGVESALIDRLRALSGDVYLTIDVDGLEVTFCPATGTPVPGGLGWWQTLRYLRALLLENDSARLIGGDVVETVPQPGTRVNEFTAAKLLCKIVAYARQRGS